MIIKTVITKIVFATALLLFFSSTSAQERSITGVVSDSIQNLLPWANVIAIPQEKNQEMKFAITDEKGRYRIILSEKSAYEISVTFLGYEKYIFQLPIGTENQTLNIHLSQASNMLNEVIIFDQPVRKHNDTLSYNVEAFKTGEERKLKDIVEKLPGIEMNKDGQITVQGKKVTKLTVDGKDFFGGGTKLAVDNIPANAVNGIDFVDKYQSVGFMRDFDESDELAMNVKLKKDKKKFAFGSVEAGTDANDKYYGHSNLFYYSPKTNVNFIGNLDNSGQEFFTFHNVMDFEGGVSSMMNDGIFGNSFYSSELYSLTENQYFTNRENKFGAINLNSQLSGRLKFSCYAIGSGTMTFTENQSTKQYLLDEMGYTENFCSKGNTNRQFGLGKIVLDYKPSDLESLLFQTKLNYSENKDKNEDISTIDAGKTEFKNLSDGQGNSANQLVEWNKKISRNRAISAGLNYNFNKKAPGQNWISNQNTFSGLLPLAFDTIFWVNQNKSSTSHKLDFIVKHYWNITNLSQINTSIGNHFVYDTYKSSEEQKMTDGTTNNFENQGFGNKMNFRFNDVFVGIFYKFKKGPIISNSGFYLHYFTWLIMQNSNVEKKKTSILPDFSIKIKINGASDLNLSYQIKSQFPKTQDLAANYTLQNYYSVILGNPALENELYHSSSVVYTNFSMFHNLMMHVRIGFTSKISGLVYQTKVVDQKHFTFPVLMSNPETMWTLSSGINKGIKKIRFVLNANLSVSNYVQEINGISGKYKSIMQMYNPEIRTNYKKWPNISLKCEFGRNTIIGGGENYSMTTARPGLSFKFDFLKGFILKSEYGIEFSKNENSGQKNRFDMANASLYYQHKKSAWGFEFSASNIFGVDARYSYMVSEFMATADKTYIFPRLMLFTLSYHL